VTALAEDLHRVLAKLSLVLHRRNSSKAATGRLTLAQLSILFTLLNHGPMRIIELAAHERVRAPTATVAIARLAKLGLVERSQDPGDHRAVLVDITKRGLAQHRESLANRTTALATMLSQLGAQDLDNLTKALDSMDRLAASTGG
jgi:DNA-binding MarR family transcriptional regulator